MPFAAKKQHFYGGKKGETPFTADYCESQDNFSRFNGQFFNFEQNDAHSNIDQKFQTISHNSNFDDNSNFSNELMNSTYTKYKHSFSNFNEEFSTPCTTNSDEKHPCFDQGLLKSKLIRPDFDKEIPSEKVHRNTTDRHLFQPHNNFLSEETMIEDTDSPSFQRPVLTSFNQTTNFNLSNDVQPQFDFMGSESSSEPLDYSKKSSSRFNRPNSPTFHSPSDSYELYSTEINSNSYLCSSPDSYSLPKVTQAIDLSVMPNGSFREPFFTTSSSGNSDIFDVSSSETSIYRATEGRSHLYSSKERNGNSSANLEIQGIEEPDSGSFQNDGCNVRRQKCSLCFNHGIITEKKGHKYKCKYVNCDCNSCFITKNRQKTMKNQQKLTRDLLKMQQMKF